MSVGTFFLPIRIEPRPFRGDGTQVVVPFAEEDFRNPVEGDFPALPSALLRSHVEREAQEADGAIFFRQGIACELHDGRESQRRKALFINGEPAAILCRATLVTEFAGASAQCECLEEMTPEVGDLLGVRLVAWQLIRALAELLKERFDLVVEQMLLPALHGLRGQECIVGESNSRLLG